MQDIDAKILGKIKKCLALSSSDNANEAATALRQAHALMAAHGVSAAQITMAEIGEASAKSRTMSRSKPALWEGALASVVGKAFGCQLMIIRTPLRSGKRVALNDGSYIFVGLAAQAQVASYTFDVLGRKCKAARAAWIAEKLPGMSQIPGGKRTATSLGDEFAIGWVRQVTRLVQEFANPEPIEQAITAYIDDRTRREADPKLLRKPKAEHDAARQAAREYGMRAARDESIHRPVDGAAAPLQLA